MLYRIGLIGLGQIGLGYDLGLNSTYIQTHYRAILDQKRMKLAFVFDLDSSRYSYVHSSVLKLSNLTQVKEKLSEIDVLVLATPTTTHLKILKQLQLKNERNFMLLLEKPVGEGLSSNVKINEYLQNLIYRVNYIRRSVPTFSKIKKYLSQAKGWQMNCEFNGEWLNIGSHFFDLFLYFSDQTEDLRYIWVNENTLEVRSSNKNVLVLVRKHEKLDFPYRYQIKADEIKIIFDEKREVVQFMKDGLPKCSSRLSLRTYQKHVYNDLIELLDVGANKNMADGSSSIKFHQILGGRNDY